MDLDWENNNSICSYRSVSFSLYPSFPMYTLWKQTFSMHLGADSEPLYQIFQILNHSAVLPLATWFCVLEDRFYFLIGSAPCFP